MKPEDAGPVDDRLDALLLAYDEALAADRTPDPTAADSLPPGELARLEAARACLRRLEADRRRGRSFPPGDPAPAVEEGLSSALAAADGQLGRFRLVRELGRGAHGVVYLGHDPFLHREVALKLPRPEVLVTPERARRFLAEGRAAAALAHPNLVPVHEAGEVGPLCYLVSAYCPGPTLREWLAARSEPVPPREAAALITPLADGVHYMHSRGIWHRDIKPGNILLVSGEPDALVREEASLASASGSLIPKLTDFGLAKLAEQDGTATRTGVVLGTLSYMAPEQAEGRVRDVGPASDVYALGAVLYELLTGRPPFRGATDADTLLQVIHHEPVPPRRLRADLPRDLEAVCLKCLEKRPERRYASAAELADDLRRFLQGQPTRARPVAAWSRAARWCRRRPGAIAVLVGAALAVGLLEGGLWWHREQLHEYDAALSGSAQREQERLDEAERQRSLAWQYDGRAREEVYARQFPKIATTWKEGNTAALWGLLNALRPAADGEDVCGFEWRYLWGQGKALRSLSGHETSIDSVAFTDGGRRCISTNEGKGLVVWDVAGGRPVAEWTGHRQAWGNGRLSPDGKRLASVSGSHLNEPCCLQLWDVERRQCLANRESPGAAIYWVALSPDGRTVAYSTRPVRSDARFELRLWNAATREDWLLRPSNEAHPQYFEFSPDGRTLAVAASIWDGRKRVELWDVAAGRLQSVLNLEYSHCHALTFSSDGQLLATASWNGRVWLWDVSNGEPRGVLSGLPDKVGALAFAPDDRTLVVGTHRERDPRPWSPAPRSRVVETQPRPEPAGSLSLWDVASASRLGPVLRLDYGVIALAVSPDGRTVAAGGLDGALHLWEPARRPAHVDLRGPAKGEAWAGAFSPDGHTLAAGYDDQAGPDRQTLLLWDLATRKVRATLTGHEAMVFDVAFTPDSRTLASCSWDTTVKLWDVPTGQLRATLRGHPSRVRALAVSPDGRTLVSGGEDNLLRIWDLPDGRQRGTVESKYIVDRVVFAPDGQMVAAATREGLFVWKMSTGDCLHSWRNATRVHSMAFAPDGRTLVAGYDDGSLLVWELATGRKQAQLPGHPSSNPGGIGALAFSPDGRTLASGGADRTVRLWQVATGTELLRFDGLPAFVHSLAFSPDGRTLAAALHDGTVRLWEADPGL